MKTNLQTGLLTELPYGRSILPIIMEKDPMPYFAQVLLLLVTTFSVCVIVPLSSPLLAACFGLDSTWDKQHKVSTSEIGMANLFQFTLGLSTNTLQLLGLVTLISFGALALADSCGAQWTINCQGCSSQCYETMFCEPKRPGRLVARLGNTYSNFIYLFGACCILLSSPSSAFWVADVMFGFMLLLLAIFSGFWHASNWNKSHYPDLWAMDACIVYLLVRALGLCMFCVRLPPIAGPIVTATIYALLLVKTGTTQWRRVFFTGPFDHSFPASGRSRLFNHDMYTTGVCLFLGMPVLYMIIPGLMEVCFVGSTGSAIAAVISGASLAIGWSLRMFERFALDGWKVMDCILRRGVGHPSKAQLLAAALVSPTAILHVFTGITLLFGYVWMRSEEDVCALRSTCGGNEVCTS